MGTTTIEWTQNPDGTPGKSCQSPGCESKVLARGLCRNHYEALGTSKPPIPPRSTPCYEERFWQYVKKSASCWEWQAGTFTNGYGQFRVGPKKVKAHRFAFELTNGPIPEGLKVLHKCDNPPCVRPDHLFVGTDQDNMDDRGRKGRTKNGSREHPELWRGELNPAAKIDAATAIEIRNAYKPGITTMKNIALSHGISLSQVANIVAGRSWKA